MAPTTLFSFTPLYMYLRFLLAVGAIAFSRPTFILGFSLVKFVTYELTYV